MLTNDSRAKRLLRDLDESFKMSPTSLCTAETLFSLHKAFNRLGLAYEALWCLVLANAAFLDQSERRRAFDCVVAFDTLRGVDTRLRYSGDDDRRWYAISAVGEKRDVGVRVPKRMKRAFEAGVVLIDSKGFLRPGLNTPVFRLPGIPPLWPLCEECEPDIEAHDDGTWRLSHVDPYCSRCGGQGYEPSHCVPRPLPQRPPLDSLPDLRMFDAEGYTADTSLRQVTQEIDADILRIFLEQK